MINILFNREVVVELVLLWRECCKIEGEVSSLNHGDEFLVSISSIVIKGSDGDIGLSEGTLRQEAA